MRGAGAFIVCLLALGRLPSRAEAVRVTQHGETNRLTLSWRDPAFLLQSSPRIDGTWTDVAEGEFVADGTRSADLAASKNRTFYRLRQKGTGVENYVAHLSGANERPALTNTTGSAVAVLTLDGTNLLFDIVYRGLSDRPRTIKLYGNGRAETNALVLGDLSTFIDASSGKDGRVRGAIALRSDLINVLISSAPYINITTSDYPNGEMGGDANRFPIETGDQLSPPIVMPPIHECAEVVHVFGFVPHADVKVYANFTELIGEDEPAFGFADVKLTRALKLGETVTATQTVNNKTSSHSLYPVPVEHYPLLAAGFPKPDVGDDLYECGVIVPVGNLIESVRVKIFGDGALIGEDSAPGNWKPIFTSPLTVNERVTAIQVACEDNPTMTLSSPESDSVFVKAAPNPMPSPVIQTVYLIPGNDAVPLQGLLVGALVRVFDHGALVGSGYATADANWAPINIHLSTSSSITATQELCGHESPPSPPETPNGNLPAPSIVAPVCQSQKYVIVQNTIVNSTVVILRNGQIAGYGGAVFGDLILALSPVITLSPGDVLTAYQYMGSTLSAASVPVTVSVGVSQPVPEILGGEPFFFAEPGEQQIDGPVFPRGRGKPICRT